MPTSISARRDVEASIFTASANDRTAVVGIRSTLLSEGSRFASTLSALYAALERVAVESQPLFGQFLPGALADAIRKMIARIVGHAYRAVRDDLQAVKRTDATRTATINETPASLPFGDEDRAEFRSLDLGRQAAWILAADRSQLAALLVAGRPRFPGLPDEVWDMTVERHAVLAHIEKTGLTADFALKPTPDQPANVGPDNAAAEDAAREAFRRWRADRGAVDDVEGVLRSVIVAVAVATDLTVEDAFRLLDGAA